jgi:DNA-binding XRE family transcriptional regulator
MKRYIFDKEKLKALIAKDMNVPTLSAIIGVKKATIYAWTRGKAKPNGENLLMMTDAFGIDSPYWFYNVEEVQND